MATGPASSFRYTAVLFIGLSLFGPGTLHAVTLSWNEPVDIFGTQLCSGSFHDADCWGGLLDFNPPSANDTAVWNYNHAISKTVSFSSDVTNYSAQVTNDRIFWDLAQHTYSLTAPSNVAALAVGTQGFLEIHNGRVDASAVLVVGGYLVTSGEAGWLEADVLLVSNAAGSRLDVLQGSTAVANTILELRGEADVYGYLQTQAARVGLSAADIGIFADGTWNNYTDVEVNDLGSLAVDGVARMFRDLIVSGPSASVDTHLVNGGAGGVIDVRRDLLLQAGAKAYSDSAVVDNSAVPSRTGMLHVQGYAQVSGQDSRWNTDLLEVGRVNSGRMDILNGGQVNAVESYVGRESGSNGTVVVAGTGGDGSNAILNAGALVVGGDSDASGGAGYLQVDTGGRVFAGGLKIWDAGQVRTTTGGTIDVFASLILTDGGRAWSAWGSVDSAGVEFANDRLSARGGVTVTGSGSAWEMGTLIAGRNGAGSLTVSNGGMAKANYAYVGEFGGSTGGITVGGTGTDGTVALLDIGAGGLFVGGNTGGSGGNGTVTVNAGGRVNAGSLKVWNGNSHVDTTGGGAVYVRGNMDLTGGGSASSGWGVVDNSEPTTQPNLLSVTGTAAVSGPGSAWQTTDLRVGWFNRGVLNVSDAGAGTAAGDAIVGWWNGSDGQLTVSNGGLLSVDGDAFVGLLDGAVGAVTVGGTDQQLNRASLNVQGGVYLGGNGLFNGGLPTANGTSQGTLNVNAGGLVNAGSLKVWNNHSSVDTTGGGTIVLAGDLTVTGGGTITSRFGVIGPGFIFPDSTIHVEDGAAAVTGAGSVWSMEQLVVSKLANLDGADTLTVSDGGEVFVAGGSIIGGFTNASGKVIVSNGGVFRSGSDALVAASQADAVSMVTVGGTDAAGNAARWNVGGRISLGRDDGGAGSLVVDEGGLVNAMHLDVNGAESRVDTTGGGIVGLLGELTLTGGGTAHSFWGIVDSAEGFNTIDELVARGGATVSGSGSTWHVDVLEVGRGDGATGNLVVVDGGAVIAQQAAYVGVIFAGSQGQITVGGTGADGAPARLNIAGSGLWVGGTPLGKAGTGTVTVNSGGVADVEGLLHVWERGVVDVGTVSAPGGVVHAGVLALVDGGQAASAHGRVGNASNGGGTLNVGSRATVSGAGSRWTMHDLEIGANGTEATLTIADGGQVVSNGASVGSGADILARLEVKAGGMLDSALGSRTGVAGGHGEAVIDGTWNGGTTMDIGAYSATSHGTGKVTVNERGLVTAGNLKIWNGDSSLTVDGTVNAASVTNEGHLQGSGVVQSNVRNRRGGIVGPGNSPGLLSIIGDYTQEDGSLLIEIGGLTAATEYDVLDVTGTALLDGILEVELYDLGGGLFEPVLGDSFDILTAETISGSFDTLLFAALGAGLAWDVSYLADELGSADVLRLSVVSAVPVPAGVWLFGSGVLGLIATARRRNRVHHQYTPSLAV